MYKAYAELHDIAEVCSKTSRLVYTWCTRTVFPSTQAYIAWYL